MNERTSYIKKALLTSAIAGGIIGGVINESSESALKVGAEWFIGFSLMHETTAELDKLSKALIGRRKINSIYRAAWAIVDSTVGSAICGHVIGGAIGSPEIQMATIGLSAIVGFAHAGLGVMREYSFARRNPRITSI